MVLLFFYEKSALDKRALFVCYRGNVNLPFGGGHLSEQKISDGEKHECKNPERGGEDGQTAGRLLVQEPAVEAEKQRHHASQNA